mmetsp:Transcript_8377/g.20148  ORF Transcript_8377/g.20148 Transcript_8377/m.20148 type:complete len:82 (-) Transcript_8377:354-599(-)
MHNYINSLRLVLIRADRAALEVEGVHQKEGACHPQREGECTPKRHITINFNLNSSRPKNTTALLRRSTFHLLRQDVLGANP